MHDIDVQTRRYFVSHAHDSQVQAGCLSKPSIAPACARRETRAAMVQGQGNCASDTTRKQSPTADHHPTNHKRLFSSCLVGLLSGWNSRRRFLLSGAAAKGQGELTEPPAEEPGKETRPARNRRRRLVYEKCMHHLLEPSAASSSQINPQSRCSKLASSLGPARF